VGIPQVDPLRHASLAPEQVNDGLGVLTGNKAARVFGIQDLPLRIRMRVIGAVQRDPVADHVSERSHSLHFGHLEHALRRTRQQSQELPALHPASLSNSPQWIYRRSVGRLERFALRRVSGRKPRLSTTEYDRSERAGG
jgi:hypothetical protein